MFKLARYVTQKFSILLVIFASFILLTGCSVTSRKYEEIMEDPLKKWEFESTLKTEKDMKYWNRMKKNSNDGLFKVYVPDE